MTEKKRTGPWRPGESGNPKGKPPGTGVLEKLRASIAGHVPDILAGLVTAAKAGDVMAARLILERVLPPVKPTEHPVALQLPDGGSLTDKAHALLGAAAAGALAPGQAAQLIAALGSVARIAEVDELAARIAALEQRHANSP